MDIGVIIAISLSVVTLIAVIGSGFYWSGSLSSHVKAQGAQIATIAPQLTAQGEQIAAQGAQ